VRNETLDANWRYRSLVIVVTCYAALLSYNHPLRLTEKATITMSAQYFTCTKCHKRSPSHQKLFESLYAFQRNASELCPICGGEREFHVSLDFQLGAGDGDFKVVSALLPEKLESWLGDEEQEVTLYPFLVVLERADHKRFCWMPYWHVTGKEARYGQHAVCLDQSQFESLMMQVDEKELEPA